QDHLAPRKRKPSSAKPPGVLVRRRSLLAPTSSARRRHPQASPAPLGTGHAAGSLLYERRRTQPECSRPPVVHLRVPPPPSAVGQGGPVEPDRSARFPCARSPLLRVFSHES